MNIFDKYTVLLAPYISEKSTILAEKHKQFLFKVRIGANKIQIKDAVEKMFNVKVNNVTTSLVKGKVKNFKNTKGKKSNWKKAHVSLAEGHDINFAN